jgi:hypothetical protein
MELYSVHAYPVTNAIAHCYGYSNPNSDGY